MRKSDDPAANFTFFLEIAMLVQPSIEMYVLSFPLQIEMKRLDGCERGEKKNKYDFALTLAFLAIGAMHCVQRGDDRPNRMLFTDYQFLFAIIIKVAAKSRVPGVKLFAFFPHFPAIRLIFVVKIHYFSDDFRFCFRSKFPAFFPICCCGCNFLHMQLNWIVRPQQLNGARHFEFLHRI